MNPIKPWILLLILSLRCTKLKLYVLVYRSIVLRQVIDWLRVQKCYFRSISFNLYFSYFWRRVSKLTSSFVDFSKFTFVTFYFILFIFGE